MAADTLAYRGLAAAMALVNLMVLLAFLALILIQFDQIRTGLEQERLRIVGERASGPFASAAAIGLDLSGVRNIDVLLERSRQLDDAILAIHVLDSAGRIVATTDQQEDVEIGPETARKLSAGASEVGFRDGSEFSYIVSFRGADDRAAGSLILQYSGAEARTAVWAMAGRLATAALVFFLLASIVTFHVMQRAFRFERARDREFIRADESAVRTLWRAQDARSDGGVSTEVEAALAEAEAQYSKARGVLP